MIRYKDTHAAKGSQLAKALDDKNPALAKSIYDKTTEAFFKTYGDEAAKGLMALAKQYK